MSTYPPQGGGGGGGVAESSPVVDAFTAASLRLKTTIGADEPGPGDVVYVANVGFYAWDGTSTATDDASANSVAIQPTDRVTP
jgi:hypothetical protein